MLGALGVDVIVLTDEVHREGALLGIAVVAIVPDVGELRAAAQEDDGALRHVGGDEGVGTTRSRLEPLEDATDDALPVRLAKGEDVVQVVPALEEGADEALGTDRRNPLRERRRAGEAVHVREDVDAGVDLTLAHRSALEPRHLLLEAGPTAALVEPALLQEGRKALTEDPLQVARAARGVGVGHVDHHRRGGLVGVDRLRALDGQRRHVPELLGLAAIITLVHTSLLRPFLSVWRFLLTVHPTELFSADISL